MDFRFTEEQQDFARLAEQVAAAAAPANARPDATEVDLSPFVETGLLTMLLPEAQGGGGASLVEAAILAEQLGRHLVPSVVVATALLAPAALDLVPADTTRSELADSLTSGRPGTIAVADDLSWPPCGPALVWGWHPDAFVLAPVSGGLAAVASEGLSAHPTEDPGLIVAPIESEGLDVNVERSPAGQRFLATANVIGASVLVGHMQAALDRAVEYANEREQFGVKIGTFQAVKHLCADMFVDLEASRSAAYGAAAIAATTEDYDEAARAAAVAKAWCGDAGVRVCENSIQVHGGIGFTWECDVHWYLRAALVMRASFMNVERALDVVGGLDRGPA